jgi:hypothetical protein
MLQCLILLQGPLSSQSALHASVASSSVLPAAIDDVSQSLIQTGVLGIEGIAVLPADQPVRFQPLTVLGPS